MPAFLAGEAFSIGQLPHLLNFTATFPALTLSFPKAVCTSPLRSPTFLLRCCPVGRGVGTMPAWDTVAEKQSS